MKRLFTTKRSNYLFAEVEGSVYSYFDHSANKYIFLDNDGNALPNYVRPPIVYEDEIEIDDPNFFEKIGDGFYTYTSHEVTYDIDGRYGLFGIKYNNGQKLTEEIYCQVDIFCNGLCAVSIESDKWGCIDTNGNLVIPYNFHEEMRFNKYGVAVGNKTLIDRTGNEIPNTQLNSIDGCEAESRYFVFSFLNDEQFASINKYGTAPDITVNIYDTKTRKYILKGIPECVLDVSFFDGEPEVVLAAKNLIYQYDSVNIQKDGTIICEKDGLVTVYDYYQ